MNFTPNWKALFALHFHSLWSTGNDRIGGTCRVHNRHGNYYDWSACQDHLRFGCVYATLEWWERNWEEQCRLQDPLMRPTLRALLDGLRILTREEAPKMHNYTIRAYFTFDTIFEGVREGWTDADAEQVNWTRDSLGRRPKFRFTSTLLVSALSLEEALRTELRRFYPEAELWSAPWECDGQPIPLNEQQVALTAYYQR